MSAQREPDERDLRYLKFVAGRREGLPEEDIAKKLRFGSPQALYKQLGNDGFPVCPECGALHPDEEHRHETPEKRRARRGDGESVELPSAANASEQFESALKSLLADVKKLGSRNEYLKDERFVAVSEVSAEVSGVHHRLRKADFSLEEWRRWCEERGLDPDAEHHDVPVDVTMPSGVSPVPPEPLMRLIAVHALSGGSPEDLVKALHPDPEVVDLGRLEAIVDRMEKEARRFAIGVRGGELRTGRRAAPLSTGEQLAAIYIQRRRGEGVPDDQIIAELRSESASRLAPGITAEEFERLANLRLD